MNDRLLTVYAPPVEEPIVPGSDLAAILINALRRNRIDLKDGDVLVIASKVVSKATGRITEVRDRAEFEELVSANSTHLVAERSYASGTTVQVVRTHSGTVQAAAGLDQSNSGGAVVLHPHDSDRSADELRARVEKAFAVRIGVVISDTTSRPWRVGVGDFALGLSGFSGLDDQRGRLDDDGRVQTVTVRAVADEIAAAADLVKGSSRGLPMALVRGAGGYLDNGTAGARALNRELEDDWFRCGHVEAVHRGLGVDRLPGRAAAGDGGDDILERVSRALRVVRAGESRTPGHEAWRMRIEGAGSRVIISPSDAPASPQTDGPPLLEAMVGLGSLVERLHTALFAEDLTATTRWRWEQSSYPRGAVIDIGLQMPRA
ncbi:coenzyme F420-0:L-glutamate ligase/coenzyme F420-1:gamma-L-glutamate ligase [Brevibacterium sanguinis]|uniref:Coenzyme F420-0:L-glutamate ligase/coenzyme F420-1:gamma-L-glutamate ligase n=2 Tax=Brevibacterium TaxID=1696 RepID=A0A366IMS6_9MICO|nr:MULTISPECIES: coenzyme F420-0:L-glutamate ligase [Brevibacterium]RBP66135.1 coenzyme F420-0:L-glutamate ligase/coenzyme F420-1:gamma-L-glutamate ligase [Brevibacterium sanguinis]RBP72786.1 coenzyme F420-0:L-glutamate ligase/coenzyme F420-1:gamma-L-glutamate ligase [Brevibacterium celere]